MALGKLRFVVAGLALAAALLPVGRGLAQSKHAQPMALYHFSSSLVPAVGAELMHVDGIMTLMKGNDGNLNGSTLHLTTGPTIAVSGSYTRTLSIAFSANGVDMTGMSTAISPNRISGQFIKNGGPIGFWVATTVTPDQAGTKYTFTSKVTSGPDRGTTYDGTLQIYGDKFGGLLGFLTLRDGTVLRVDGQDVNGNKNMTVVVREGTPMFISGTTMMDGSLRGTIAGPLAGDEGAWNATK